MTGLTAEDTKLVTLARATRARGNAPQGAAVRDLDGRTFAGATVQLPGLHLSALEVCLAMAVSAGSRGLEAAVVLGGSPPEAADQVSLDAFAPAAVLLHGDVAGRDVQPVERAVLP